MRATEDVDLFIRATPENVECLRAALRAAYDGDPHIDEISTADLLGEYPAVRYYPPTGDLSFDVMTRLGDAASFHTVDAETKDVAGTRVRIATPQFDRFLRHCARFWALAPRKYPRGVFKFRTIEDAQRTRERHSG